MFPFFPAARHYLGLLICLAVALTPARAQTDGLLQLNDETHHFLQRQKTLGHLPGAFVSHQPLSVYEARGYLDSLATRTDALTPGARRQLARLRGETPQPGAAWVQQQLSFLYANGRDFAAVEGDGYALQVNPLFYATLGRASRSGRSGVTTWRNTRGLRASGQIGPVFFETRMTENQEQPIVNRFENGTAPRLGFVLQQEGDAYDYFTATGVVGFRSRFFEVRFGREQNRWGYGQGSLMLSNFGPVYDQLQIRTSVWRLQYTNLFARFNDVTQPRSNRPDRGGNTVIPRRYGAFHRLALEVSDRVQLHAFESIIFASQEDSTVSRSGFDVAYLNPIIFYRAVERELGSPDNAMIGIGGSWITTPGVRLYGHFVLDELTVSEIGTGYWANKWGWLIGTHLVPRGLSSLSARVEFARQRPFLYAHFFSPNAFLHYDDALGHPAGTNSVDLALFLDYRPAGRWQASLSAAFTRRGRNTAFANYGADPRLSTETRVAREVGILDGVRQDELLLEGYVGLEVLPQLFVDLALRARVVDDAFTGTDRFVNPYLALRWGLPFASMRY